MASNAHALKSVVAAQDHDLGERIKASAERLKTISNMVRNRFYAMRDMIVSLHPRKEYVVGWIGANGRRVAMGWVDPDEVGGRKRKFCFAYYRDDSQEPPAWTPHDESSVVIFSDPKLAEKFIELIKLIKHDGDTEADKLESAMANFDASMSIVAVKSE